MEILFYNHTFSYHIVPTEQWKKSFFAAVPGAHLSVEAAGRLQEQRQVGLDLAAVRVGTVLGLALQGGDLILKGMIPSAWRQQTASKPASVPEQTVRRFGELTGLAPPSCQEHTPGPSPASSGTGPGAPAWTSTPLPSPAWSLTQTGSGCQVLVAILEVDRQFHQLSAVM